MYFFVDVAYGIHLCSWKVTHLCFFLKNMFPEWIIFNWSTLHGCFTSTVYMEIANRNNLSGWVLPGTQLFECLSDSFFPSSGNSNSQLNTDGLLVSVLNFFFMQAASCSSRHALVMEVWVLMGFFFLFGLSSIFKWNVFYLQLKHVQMFWHWPKKLESGILVLFILHLMW